MCSSDLFPSHDIAAEFGSSNLVYPCDVSKPEEIVALRESLKKDLGEIDFIVHSIAFAPKEGLSGRFHNISKEAFDIDMDVSVFSLIEVTRELKQLLSSNSSILTLTYYGVEMVMPGDNVEMTVELVAPIALDKGTKFAIREGDRTVGAGVVAEIIA